MAWGASGGASERGEGVVSGVRLAMAGSPLFIAEGRRTVDWALERRRSGGVTPLGG